MKEQKLEFYAKLKVFNYLLIIQNKLFGRVLLNENNINDFLHIFGFAKILYTVLFFSGSFLLMSTLPPPPQLGWGSTYCFTAVGVRVTSIICSPGHKFLISAMTLTFELKVKL